MFPSKVIAAEGEHKASRALKHAADVLMDNSGAMQVIINNHHHHNYLHDHHESCNHDQYHQNIYSYAILKH